MAGLIRQDEDGFACTVEDDTKEQRLFHADMMMSFAKAMLKDSKKVGARSLTAPYTSAFCQLTALIMSDVMSDNCRGKQERTHGVWDAHMIVKGVTCCV